MQPCLGPHDGDLPPPRAGAKGARHRPPRRLSERRVLPHHLDRHRAGAHPDPRPQRALHRDRRTRHLVADAGAAAPDQPDLPRAGDVRACRRDAGRAHPEPHDDRGLHAGRPPRHRDRARSRQRRDLQDRGEISRRLRRQPLDRPPRDRGNAVRHAGDPARAVDLHPRAETARHDARQACLDVSVAQSAPLRHRDRNRRPRDLADPQSSL